MNPSEIVLPSLEEMQAIVNRQRWLEDPRAWVREKTGEFPWSKQVEIMKSVAANRRTAVPSCHSSGKSFVSSRIIGWWIDSHPPGEAFVVTSAPTNPQVRTILWREFNRAHKIGSLDGRTNQTEWFMTMPAGNEEMVAFGRKPSDIDMSAFQGIHAKYVLVIFDEATGIPELLWEAADSLISNEFGRFLAIGNPDDPLCEFANVCKPGSGWNVLPISAFDTPAFTKEEVPQVVLDNLVSPLWVEEKRRKWGESNPLWISKVMGQFPDVSEDGLIPLEWIRQAQKRCLLPTNDVNVLGVDVGGGGDKSTVCHRRGSHARIVLESSNPDTMQTTGQIIRLLRELKASQASIDEVGIGRGVVDRAKEQKLPILGINVGQPASDPTQFLNLRSEGYWQLRDRFEAGEIDIDPDDDDLAAQLADLKFMVTSNGKIQIEAKKDMKRRGRDSPDRADALMLAFLEKRRITRATWGRRVGPGRR